ncbi:MAG: DNA repair protein RadC [Burkholderiales bacterium]|nr:DNA repair protein RadC [Burkholderiales bacterium]
MPISDWPEDERPREKLLARGPGSLSDAELLAIFLRVGVRGMSAVDLGRALLERFRSLGGLLAASADRLAEVPGIGVAKSAQLKAGLEIARRALIEQARTQDTLSSPEAVRDYLRLALRDREHEVFAAVLLDAQNRVIHYEELFRGTLTQTSVYPREVVKCALRHNAAAVIFAHNHPSGVAEPSQADRLLTDALRQALGMVDVRVLDHFVIGAAGATSFAERGLL